MTRRLAAYPSALVLASLASLASLAPLTACGGNTASSAPDSTHSGVAMPLPSGTPITAPPKVAVESQVLVGVGAPPDALASDGGFIYWNEGGTVFRIRKDGAEGRQLIIPGGTGPTPAIIADGTVGTVVYAIDGEAGSVRTWKVPYSGGDPIVGLVVPAGSGATSLAEDEDNVYVGTVDTSAAHADAPQGHGILVIDKKTQAIVRTLRADQGVTTVAVSSYAKQVFSAELGRGADTSTHLVRSSVDGTGVTTELAVSNAPIASLTAGGTTDVYWVDEHGALRTSAATLQLDIAGPVGQLGPALSFGYGNLFGTRAVTGGLDAPIQLFRVPFANGQLVGSQAEIVADILLDTPKGVVRKYGALQASDVFEETYIYLTASWKSLTDGSHGDAIMKVPQRRKP